MERFGSHGSCGFTRHIETGCSECHTPVHKTQTRYLPLSYPEIPEDPWQNVYEEIDLVEVGFEPIPGEDGVYVPLFADLKHHNMGPQLSASFDQGEISNANSTTISLWGIADTAHTYTMDAPRHVNKRSSCMAVRYKMSKTHLKH